MAMRYAFKIIPCLSKYLYIHMYFYFYCFHFLLNCNRNCGALLPYTIKRSRSLYFFVCSFMFYLLMLCLFEFLLVLCVLFSSSSYRGVYFLHYDFFLLCVQQFGEKIAISLCFGVWDWAYQGVIL